MIKTYYKFQLDKESLIAGEQGLYEGFTCVTGIFVDAIGEPDLGSSSVQCQDGGFIPKGIPEMTIEGREGPIVIPAKDLDGFLIEKLWSEPLQGEYYEKFYI